VAQNAEAPSGNGTRPETPTYGHTVDLQGYVGKHLIRAVVGTASGAQYDGHIGEGWAGSYRYTGKSTDVLLEGARKKDEETDPYHPDTFACEFVERVGNKITGNIEAT